MGTWTHPLDVTVGQYREILQARADSSGAGLGIIVDGFGIVARFPSGRPQTLAIYGRSSAAEPPQVEGALGVTIEYLLSLVADGYADTDVITGVARDPNADVVYLEVTRTAPPQDTSRVWMAPAGTDLPKSTDDLVAGGWTELGGVASAELVEAVSTDEAAKAWTGLAGVAKVGATLEFSAGPELRRSIEALLDDQLDRTIDSAERAADEMDLDRITAELRLMLPESWHLLPLASSAQDPANEEYSAEAIVQWIRDEFTRARRRAYRTGYAIGRHAAEHQEPTA